MKRKITVIGTGYVGLTAGVCFAYLGHKVICFDKEKSKIMFLKSGKVPLFEPGLSEILTKYYKNIEFATDFDLAVKKSEVIFICVDTPTKRDGSIDLSSFKEVIRKISRLLNSYKVVVNKSTVPVGTAEWTEKEIKKYYKGNFSVVSNPEFLSEGSALKDFLEPDRIIIGVDDERAQEIMLDIYSSIIAPKLIVDPKSAELIKYASNAFLATKISFINEIANLCEKTGGDITKIAKGIGMDKRIGPKFLRAGIGYGGSCFPKDISGLLSISNKYKHNFDLLRAVSKVNKRQQERFTQKVERILLKTKGNVVAAWGLAFKPNTDDTRKSPAIEIIKKLQKAGYKIRAYDPVVIENAKKVLPMKNIKFCKNALEATRGADCLALLTEWPEFSEINMRKVKSLMHHPNIIDGRNMFEPVEVKNLGFYYEGMGRK